MQTNEQRPKNFFKAALPIITFFCLMMLIEIVVMEIYFFIAAWTSGQTNFYDFLDYFLQSFIGDGSIVSMFIYGFIALFISLYWYRSVLAKQKNMPDYHADSNKYELLTGDGNHFTNYKKSCIIALIASAIGFQIVMQFFTIGLAKLAPSWAEEYQEILKATGLGESKLTWMMVIYILVGPFSEEMCFRGLTYEYSRKAIPFWGANCLQALLFGVFHGNMLQGIMAFLLGLVLGYIYGRTRNIIATIIFHISFNASTFFISEIDITKMNMLTGFIYLMIGLTVAYFGLVYFFRCVPRNYNAPKAPDGESAAPGQMDNSAN